MTSFKRLTAYVGIFSTVLLLTPGTSPAFADPVPVPDAAVAAAASGQAGPALRGPVSPDEPVATSPAARPLVSTTGVVQPTQPAAPQASPARPRVYAEASPPTGASLDLRTPVITVRLPYQDALYCIGNTLTPEQRRSTWTTGGQPMDTSGRQNIAGQDAAGAFSLQDGSNLMRLYLRQGGARVIRTDRAYREVAGWMQQQGSAGMLGDGQVRTITDSSGTRQTRTIPLVQGTTEPPDFMVDVTITAVDSSAGNMADVGAFGAHVGARTYYMDIMMTVSVTRMAVGTTVGGEEIDSFPIQKRIYADEIQGGLARFLGNTPFPVSFNFATGRRQAVEYMEGVMLQYAAYQVLLRHFGEGDPNSPLNQCNRLLPFEGQPR